MIAFLAGVVIASVVFYVYLKLESTNMVVPEKAEKLEK